jgi:DNA-binding response OmpR family regulator
MSAKRILAIEDEQDILELYVYLFKDAGYEVLTSLTGENVLQQMRDFRPDVVLMDIHLGALNGIDLCREIKTNPKTSNAVVVLASGDNSTHNIMQYSRADYFIKKPFDISLLLTRIAELT